MDDEEFDESEEEDDENSTPFENEGPKAQTTPIPKQAPTSVNSPNSIQFQFQDPFQSLQTANFLNSSNQIHSYDEIQNIINQERKSENPKFISPIQSENEEINMADALSGDLQINFQPMFSVPAQKNIVKPSQTSIPLLKQAPTSVNTPTSIQFQVPFQSPFSISVQSPQTANFLNSSNQKLSYDEIQNTFNQESFSLEEIFSNP